MDEIEYTYLAKHIPKDLAESDSKEIIDMYIPSLRMPLSLRIRKFGNKYEITKKEPLDDKDVTHQTENTIPLTQKEYDVLMKSPGNISRKIRYYYNYKDATAEIDVFQDKLEGLVLVEVEFENKKEQNKFQIPDFCLVEITNENFIAGGSLAGKSYSDIKPDLKHFNYKKLSI
jgi:CYTH domain-containing protein